MPCGDGLRSPLRLTRMRADYRWTVLMLLTALISMFLSGNGAFVYGWLSWSMHTLGVRSPMRTSCLLTVTLGFIFELAVAVMRVLESFRLKTVINVGWLRPVRC